MLTPKQIVSQLKSCTWKYNTVKTLDDKIHFGFIAQDLLDTFGEDFNFVDTSEEYYKVNYLEFIAPLVHVIQQQQSQIDDLENKIKRIEEYLDANDPNDL